MNDLTVTQVYTVLNEIVSQATGSKAIAVTNPSEFTAVATTALMCGYDNLMQAVSQVLSKTIFSIRPYYRKLGDLKVTNQRFGNHVRKLQSIDKDFEEDNRLPLTNGESVDMYTVNKPDVLQTNFYGQAVYQKSLTIFKDQIDVAFSSADELGRFITMILTNASDQIEQAHESLARGALANLIGGIYTINNANQVVHLLSEYNTATGQKLTPQTVVQPANYEGFIKWAFGRIAAISSALTERTQIFHQNVTGKEVKRHTPYRNQRVYMYAPSNFSIKSQVLSDTYHDSYLNLAANETLNFFQSIETPNAINVTPSYMGTDGNIVKGEAANVQNILGVIFDEEAIGYTTVNEWSGRTPLNPKGGYSNIFWHFTDRYWNDFTENAVLLLMD